MLRRYVHSASVDEPLVWYEGSGTTDRRYFHSDERGSIVAITDNGGLALETRAYGLCGLSPAHRADGPARYGEPESFEGSRFQYTGQIAIPEVGLYYYKARFYAPSLGRFLQTDPLGYVDGLNLYAYAHGDPINLNDPTGLAVNDEIEEIVITYSGGGGGGFDAFSFYGGFLSFGSDSLGSDSSGLDFGFDDFVMDLAEELEADTEPSQSNLIQCVGNARVFQGNSDHIGKAGGFSGSSVGDIIIDAESAAIIPSQFGVGKGILRPFLGSISGTTAGGQSFSNVADVIGNKDLGVPARNARTVIQSRYPGQFILELVGGRDEGSNVSIKLNVPATLGCPTGTRRAQ